jgi:hypothetical protein
MAPKRNKATKKQPPKKTAPKNKGRNETEAEAKIATPPKPIQQESKFDIIDIKKDKHISSEGMYCA